MTFSFPTISYFLFFPTCNFYDTSFFSIFFQEFIWSCFFFFLCQTISFDSQLKMSIKNTERIIHSFHFYSCESNEGVCVCVCIWTKVYRIPEMCVCFIQLIYILSFFLSLTQFFFHFIINKNEYILANGNCT